MRTGFFYKQTLFVPAILAGLILCVLAPVGTAGQTDTADKTIQHLLAYVASSELTFIRNSRHYNAREASAHMQKKYAHFKNEITTPEKFIELCASRSLLSGKPYQVINRQGETLKTSEWLTTELTVYRNMHAKEVR